MSISNNVSSGSLSTSPLQKRRYIMQNPQNREAYIATLSRLITTRNGWLHIARSLHGTSMKSWVYLTDRPRYRDAFGVKNLLGCTSVIIASNGGILLSNMWEMPTFLTMDYQQPARDVFRADTYDILRYGNPADPTGESIGFRYWIRGGFLISRMRPVVFIITPFTTNRERQQLGVQTELRYEAEVQSLAAALRRSIPSQQPPRIIGYTRHDRTGFEASEGDETWWGKAIVEVDQHHAEARNSRGHYVPSIDGSWRLWVEDRLEYEQHYTYPLLNWNWNRKRTSPAGP
ncbi:hypothetical protein EV356DRAFT_581248 [Viridothelium virens]|uniref:Uncharacterized protein n=1 Tax=Viridothelium virens TaxID=1048519 RepID=A0A6A6GSX6_VIRVR|nr:hypothetical protein EV356DRAFT_581248 [Viridothelium virens]